MLRAMRRLAANLIRVARVRPLAAAVVALVLAGPSRGQGPQPDRLTAEVERWSALARDSPAKDETWIQVKQASEPELARAREALRSGRRLLGLLYLSNAQPDLAAALYLAERPPDQRKDPAAFEAEWARLGTDLRSDLAPPSGSALEGVAPAALRAIAEAALPQVRVYYDASLEYGRNTMPEYGLFYLGTAQAERQLASFLVTLSAPSPLSAPPVRSYAPELRQLESRLLSAYRPPASIDEHREFIGISSRLKEARELDALGLRYGALLRELQTSLRLRLLSLEPATLDAAAIREGLTRAAPRLAAAGVDHSVGRLFLELAEADLAAAGPDHPPTAAAAVLDEVLPRYFESLAPPRPEPPAAPPQVTVTLVRWPYT